jgi:hypothetical protein
MAKKYKILGFSDDFCMCEVCGKQELKGTYALEDSESGEIIRAGSTCGARMAGWSTKEFLNKAKTKQKEDLENARIEFQASKEYVAYKNAMLFLSNENDDIMRRVETAKTQDEKNRFLMAERTIESRFAFMEPFTAAMKAKRAEVLFKYNLPKNSFLP